MLKYLLAAGSASLEPVLSAAPSLAWNSTEGVVVESPVAAVTVVTVSTVDAKDAKLAEPLPSVEGSNQIIVVIGSPNRRLEQLRRAFGHRYWGFIKVYSGSRYPF